MLDLKVTLISLR